jgi:hypothetical protein
MSDSLTLDADGAIVPTKSCSQIVDNDAMSAQRPCHCIACGKITAADVTETPTSVENGRTGRLGQAFGTRRQKGRVCGDPKDTLPAVPFNRRTTEIVETA